MKKKARGRAALPDVSTYYKAAARERTWYEGKNRQTGKGQRSWHQDRASTPRFAGGRVEETGSLYGKNGTGPLLHASSSPDGLKSDPKREKKNCICLNRLLENIFVT